MSPGVAGGGRYSGSKTTAEVDMAAAPYVLHVFLIVGPAGVLDWTRMMKHIHPMSKIGSLNNLVGLQVDSLVNMTTAGNRSGSYRTENAALCNRVCYICKSRFEHSSVRLTYLIPCTLGDDSEICS